MVDKTLSEPLSGESPKGLGFLLVVLEIRVPIRVLFIRVPYCIEYWGPKKGP